MGKAATATTGSNIEPRKREAFRVYRDLGEDYRRGAKAISTLFERVVEHAKEEIITVGKDPDGNKSTDAVDIFKAFSPDGGQSDGTLKKIASQVTQLIKAGSRKDIDFRKVIKQVIQIHDKMADKKQDRVQLTEAMINAARKQLRKKI